MDSGTLVPPVIYGVLYGVEWCHVGPFVRQICHGTDFRTAIKVERFITPSLPLPLPLPPPSLSLSLSLSLARDLPVRV